MESTRNFIESLSRGLSVLSALARSPVPLSLTELADQVGLSRSTMQRLTHTLLHLGHLDRDEETKKYRLGPRSLHFCFSVMKGLDLRKITLPYLERAAREIGETVNLAILDGAEILYVERIHVHQILNVNLQVGSRLPAHCTSLGKAILAFMPGKRLDAVLEKIALDPFTPQTITAKAGLRGELKRVRLQGFAANDEELVTGLRSVAAPVRNFAGEVIAAVNVAVPSERVSMKKLRTFFARKVLETAGEISFILGYEENSGRKQTGGRSVLSAPSIPMPGER
jgi:IclR family pca regulon transcriptional regulator